MNKKTLTIGLVILGLLAAIALLTLKSCNLYNGLSEWKGRYESLAEKNVKLGEEVDAQRLESEAVIRKKDEEIAALHVDIQESEERRGTLVNTITRLRAERDALPEPEDLESAKVIIANQDAQLQANEQLIEELRFTIAKKNDEIFKLNEKYEAQLDISRGWERKYLSEYELRLTAEEGIKKLERKLRVGNVWSKAKTGIIVAALAYLVYQEVR